MKDTKYKILLVEDDKLDRMAFTRMLEAQELPYDCKIAASASQAKEILESEKFDVIVSDYELGDGTGLEILELVKGTPFILVTGAGNEELVVQAWKAGAHDYLVKDIERNYLKTVSITIENAVRYHKMKERADLLSGAIMSTSDSVFITDLNDKFIFVNKAFCQTYGYEEKEILGKNSHILWIGKSDSKRTRSVFRTSITGGPWEVGFYHTRKDGTVFPVSLSRSIIKDENGNSLAIVGVIRDITELIKIEDKIRALNEKLQQETRIS